jgi:hypothetical protein
MADGRATEMDVEAVVVGQLALAVCEIGKTPAKVEEERVCVDPGLAAKIKLDPVAGSEVDELRETRQAGELDQVFPREFRRQSRGRELVDV